MQQFYSVLVQQIARVDASDDAQRHAVYDRARFDLMRLTGDAPASVSQAQNAALEQAIARLESEIGHIQRGRQARNGREALLDEVRRANPDLADVRLSDLPPPGVARHGAPSPDAASSGLAPATPLRDRLPDDPFADPDPMGLKAARARINELRREIGGPGAVPEGADGSDDLPSSNPAYPEAQVAVAAGEDDLRFEGGRWERPHASESPRAPEPGFPQAEALPLQPEAQFDDGAAAQVSARPEFAPDAGSTPGGAASPGFVQDARSAPAQPNRPARRIKPAERPAASGPTPQTATGGGGTNLPATQTRMPPRLGRDPQHLLRARSIGSPTVFALLGASGAVALIGLIALVVALDPTTGGVGADPGQRPIVLFSPTRPTQFSVPRGNTYVRVPGDDGGVHLSSRIAELSTGPNSAAIAVRIAPVATDVLQGQDAEVRIEARQITNLPSQSFAVAYRTGAGPEGVGPSSGWNQFMPTPEFSEYSFRYTVPAATRDDVVHDILIWADTAAQGGSIEVRSITINLLQ